MKTRVSNKKQKFFSHEATFGKTIRLSNNANSKSPKTFQSVRSNLTNEATAVCLSHKIFTTFFTTSIVPKQKRRYIAFRNESLFKLFRDMLELSHRFVFLI